MKSLVDYLNSRSHIKSGVTMSRKHLDGSLRQSLAMRLLLLGILSVTFSLGFGGAVFAQKSGSTTNQITDTSATTVVASLAAVSTDRMDYMPGSTVEINGVNFQPGESVTVQVLRDALDPTAGVGHFPWTVFADSNGKFLTSWALPYDNAIGDQLIVSASGSVSGLSAQTSFINANTFLNITSPALDTSICSTVVGDSIDICVNLAVYCPNGGSIGLAGRSVIVSINSGDCGSGSSASSEDTVVTSVGGAACVRLALPTADGGYTIQARFLGEEPFGPCLERNTSACAEITANDSCLVLGASSDCHPFTIDSLACSPPVQISCPTDTAIVICEPQEVCLTSFVATTKPGYTNTVNYGTFSGDSVCFFADTSGLYTFELVCLGPDGKADTCITNVDVLINTAPVIMVNERSYQSCLGGGTISHQVTAFDGDFDAIVWSLTGGAGTIDQSGLITFTADTSGVYCFTVRASDDCSFDEQQICLLVALNDPPQLFSYTDTLSACGVDTLCFIVAGSDPNFGDRVEITQIGGGGSFSMTTDTSGVACFAPGTLSAPTVFEFVFQITDSCIRSNPQMYANEIPTDTIRVLVLPGNAPVVTLPGDYSVAGCGLQDICVPLTVTDVDNDILSITTTLGTIDPMTGDLCFAASGPGDFTAIVTATDSCGLSASDTIVVTVSESVFAPVNCPVDTNIFVCDTGDVCVPFGVFPPDVTVEIFPKTAYYNDSTGTICFFTNCSVNKKLTAIVSNGCQTDTCTFNVNVTMNSAPLVIAAPVLDTTICAPATICLPVGISDLDYGNTTVTVSNGGVYDKIQGVVCQSVDTTGTYVTVVTVTDDCGASSSDTLVINAVVNQAPEVVAGADLSLQLCGPQQICVSFVSSDIDGPVPVITPNIGQYDLLGRLICFTPDTAGVYTVIGSVIDDCGAVASDTAIITIDFNQAPQITLGADTTIFQCSLAEICLPVSIPSIAGNANIVSVVPSIGYYNPNTKSICFTPAREGVFEEIVVATDDCGATSVDTISVTVTSGVIPALSCPVVPVAMTVCGPNQVNYALTFSPSNADLTSSFGTISNGVLSFTADTSGTYEIAVSAGTSCGVDSCTIVFAVTVGEAATLTCPVDTSVFVCDSGAVIVTPVGLMAGSAEVVVSPIGQYQNGFVSFVADTSGVYDIGVVAQTACGADSCSFRVRVVFNSAPTLSGPNDTTVFICDNEKLFFHFGASDIDSNIASITTNIGYITNDTVCFGANSAGEYLIALSVTDSCGLTAYDTTIVTVLKNSVPVVDLRADQSLTLCAPDSICFSASIFDIDNNLATIDVVGGVYSNGQICAFVSASGQQTIIATATDSCGLIVSDTVNLYITLNEAPLVMSKKLCDTSLCAPVELCFGYSVQDDNLQSVTVIGAIDRGNEICFIPDTSGTYIIVINALDSCGALTSDTTIAIIDLNSAPVVVAAADTTILGCGGTTVCLPFGVSDIDSNIVSVVASGGTSIFYNNGEICFDPDTSGTYNIVLTATDSCGLVSADTTVVTVIGNTPPTASFASDTLDLQCVTTEVCVPVTYGDVDGNIASVTAVGGTWNSQAREVCFTPQNDGAFTLIVNVADSCGAVASDTIVVIVNIGADFTLNCPVDTSIFICQPDTLRFGGLNVPAGAEVVITQPSVGYDAINDEIYFFTNCSVVKEIEMIVTNGCFVDTCSFIANVTMNSNPLVITAPDIAALLCEPQDVCFSVGISDADYNLAGVQVAPFGSYNPITGKVCVSIDTTGLYLFTVTGVDNCGASDVDSIYVNAVVNRAPVVVAPVDTSVFLCSAEEICLPVDARDDDGNLFSVGVNYGVYDELAGTVCFTPSNAGGEYSIITTAVDSCGMVAADTVVVSVIVNSPPVISDPVDSIALLCAPGEVCVPIDIIDTDGNVMAITTSGGARYDETTGSICFTAGVSGRTPVTVTVIDSCGMFVQKTIVVDVRINSAPVVVAGVDTTVSGCGLTEVCIPVGISDAEYDLLDVRVLPYGSYDPITGTVCLTPIDTGSIAVIIVATDSCGAVGADTTWITPQIVPQATIACPPDTIDVMLCGADTVCQIIDVSPASSVVSASFGTYANGQLCFFADTSGVYEVALSAGSGCGTDSCNVVFNVVIGGQPAFTCPPPSSEFLCAPGLVRRPVGVITGGAIVTVSPVGSYDAGMVSFNADTAGLYTITTVATSECGSDTCVFEVNVELNAPPTIVALPDTSVFICDIGTVEICRTVDANDVRGGIVAYETPSFASFDTLSSSICFTPDTAGVYQLWTRVTDSCGISAVDSFTVTVTADVSPVIVCQDTVSVEFCEPVTQCFAVEVGPQSAVLSASAGSVIANDSICLALDTSGIYTVQLIAANNCGADTCELVVKATLLTTPTITCPTDQSLFACAPDTVCLPFTVTPPEAFPSVTAPAYIDFANSTVCIPITGDTTMTLTLTSSLSCAETSCTFTVTTDLDDAPVVSLGKDIDVFQCTIDSICIPVQLSDDEGNIVSVVADQGAYDPVRGVVCFLPATIGQFRIAVTATDSCGLFDTDTVAVNVTTGIAASIVCPEGIQQASLCAPDTVCLLIPVTPGVDSLNVSFGSYNATTRELCFFADTSGIYVIDMNAFAPCGNASCQVTVDVKITSTPELSCPAPIDTLLCVGQVDSFSVNVGAMTNGSVVEVKPFGTYNNGVVTFAVDTAGLYVFDVLASTSCGSDSCHFEVNIRNNSVPELTLPQGLMLARCADDTTTICLNGILATDAEGDAVTITKICGPGELQVFPGDSAEICFLPASADSVYEFCIQVTDGCHTRTESFFVTLFPTSDCGVCLTVSIVGPECTPVGQEVNVDIVAETNEPIGGYDMLISYDQSALAFLSAGIGGAVTDWEYFTFRQGPFTNCGGGCPNGLLRLVAIADINDGANHPPDSAFQPQGVLARLKFRISNDQSLGNQFVPVSFYWLDCGDNGFSDPGGDNLFIDARIFNAENKLVWDEFDDVAFPESSRLIGVGSPDASCPLDGKYTPSRCVDFVNGGVCIIDPDKIDARGDLNLNGLAYEVADAVVYTNYFVIGLDAFIFSIAGQTAASDINADGATLTVADLVHLIRVLIGDAEPIPRLAFNTRQPAVLFTENETGYAVTSDADIALGAAFLTFSYSGAPPESITLGSGAGNMDLAYRIEDGMIRALVYESPDAAQGEVIPSGKASLLSVNVPASYQGELKLVSAEFSDANGWQVINGRIAEKVIPTTFALSQNYPNPFNPSTKIELSLPQRSAWSITVYNMLGQTVRKLTGEDDPGVIQVNWDGKNEHGASVASGVYLYSAKAGAFAATKKMLLLK